VYTELDSVQAGNFLSAADLIAEKVVEKELECLQQETVGNCPRLQLDHKGCDYRGLSLLSNLVGKRFFYYLDTRSGT
jgi:hypothetical protein